MISIKSANEYTRDIRSDLARVFVDAYYSELSQLSENKSTLIKVFTPAINTSVFYTGEVNNKIVAIAACSNNKNRALIIRRSDFIKNFGLIKGYIAYKSMNADFNRELSYPPHSTYIECVATMGNQQGKGIATQLLNHIINNHASEGFILEVTDVNNKAYNVYRKLGFSEFERKKVMFSKFKGYNETICMKHYRNE